MGTILLAAVPTNARDGAISPKKAIMRRGLTSSLALLAVASSGNGQAWLLHAHDEHPWHAHAIDLADGLEPVRGDSMPGDDHEHDELLSLQSSDEGIVVVLNSEPAISGCAASDVQSALGTLGSNPISICQALPVSLMHDARLWQRQCAHVATSSRAIESVLRSNHALLI